MSKTGWICGRVLLLFVVSLMPTTLLRAAPPQQASLTGQLLVSAPGIGDPRFEHTVIFVVQHDAQGTIGIVINRPVGTEKMSDLLDALGADGTGVTGSVRLFAGGPVQPEVGFVLHGTDYRDPRTRVIAHRFAVTSDIAVLRAIARGSGPKRRLVAFGYAGWGPGQLENEIEHNDWFIVPASVALLFEIDRDSVWQRAYDERRLQL
jgi:putative transcriptional regulator